MPFIGNKPSAVPLTSADITDSIITSAKITDATIVNGDIANATITLAKLSATGTASSSTFLRGDNTWGTAGATAGQVIQVLGATDSTYRNTTSSSFVTASNTLSVTITPASTSNKILILVNISMLENYDGRATIYRDSTNLSGTAGFLSFLGSLASWSGSMMYLDSPATTSATTYQVYFRSNSSGSPIYWNPTNSTSTITCLEIKG
jgi:hypothetical protein